MGIVDRAIAFAESLSPEWAMRRAAARSRIAILNSGYDQHGASRTKKALKGWVTSTGGPDSDIVDNLETLRERSRDLFMGDGLASGALKTIVTNEVGAGLALNCAINARLLGLSDDDALAWEDNTEREFALWAGTRMCDAERRHNFGQIQALARLSQLMSGDVFALLPTIPRAGERYDLRVQLIEADRVCDPPVRDYKRNILGGVEIGEDGDVSAYWIAKSHPGDVGAHLRVLSPLDSHVRVPAFGPATGRPLVLHLMHAERPGQRRGVPLLSPVIEDLKQLSRYTQAELTAAVVSGFFTVAITTPSPQTPLGQVIPEAQRIDKGDPNAFELASGMAVGLAPGEQVTPIDPSRPNSAFDQFVTAICKQIGAATGIGYELLVRHFSSSYSASRGALLEAWKVFAVGRANLAANLCQPVYEAWLEEAIARGVIVAPGFFSDEITRAAWCGAEWHGPTQGQLDPRAEVEAAALRVREGFSTRTRETRELTGGDFWDANRLRAREENARRADHLDGSSIGALALTPTDVAALAMVNEGRASVGLPPVDGEVGARWVAEHQAKIAAENAPEIAKVATAESGGRKNAAL